jgi:3-oxoacyl-[acyl-carrier protein] reductase
VISYAASADKAQAVVRELEAKGVRAAAIKAEQASPTEVEALVNQVAARFGRLDILVNNAAVFVTGVVGDPATDLAALERQFAINVGGVAAAVRSAVPLLREGGRIISISSGAGDASPWPGIADYSATKAAIAAYTRGWARDLGPKGITVNIVQPGHIDTEMNPATSQMAQSEKNVTALKRYGKPEEVAAVVAFLARPEASYVTGASINVDGGYNA